MVRKAVLVRGSDKFIDTVYEPPLKIGRGIWSESVEKPGFTMSRVVIPPGARNQRHYHVNCDAGMHVLKGKLKIFLGPDCNLKEGIAEEGDFIFVPKGTIHGFMNMSAGEPAEIVSCYGGVSHKNEAGTFYVEPVWEK
jgi:quercetin dioxygenase-like cupin family protein